MKHSVIFKSLAIVLAAVALLAAVCGAAGMIALAESGLYNKTVTQLRQERMEDITRGVADSLVREYIRDNLSNMTENAMNNSGFYNSYEYYLYAFNDELGRNGWNYAVWEAKSGKVLKTNGPAQPGSVEYSHTMSLVYPALLWYEEVKEGQQATRPAAADKADECMRWYNPETDTYFDYYLQYVSSPAYTVSIYLPEDYYPYNSANYWGVLTIVSDLQHLFLPCLLIGLAVFVLAMIYLVAAAGHSRGTAAVRAGGLNRIPLDLYTAAAVGGVILLVAVGIWLVDWFFLGREPIVQPGVDVLTALPFLGASLLAVSYFFCLAAQFKTPGGFWWRNSVIGRGLQLLRKLFRTLWRYALRLFGLMNVMWQWALVGAGLCFGWFLAVVWGAFLPCMLMLAVTVLVVGYGAYAFGIILAGARRMARGDLNRQIPTKYLLGAFADCAAQLNSLADVAMAAARNQLKSERMKTELITNVSHDIKTPLTSIINYVDLLQKPHTDREGTEYLAVLARQSGQLKKLIDDLMEMSKASTGNMAVEITELDVTEAVNQALGEFSDKLAAVPLMPVIRFPEEKTVVRADGRLVWRALSNLLQNAVKYALPGTRLYVDVVREQENVVVSVKNISREELNITADELMERFVRGDASRNTEGSGLGLNIAKSLMELQKGKLQLTVDGDLFKASLVFPAAE